MNVYWSESALADIQAIEATIARHSQRYARAMVARIHQRGDQLSRFPRLGPVVPEYQNESLREVFESPYRIVYRVLDDRVEVIAVVHAARRLPGGL
jgi:plasmid stabilization system protein ParE